MCYSVELVLLYLRLLNIAAYVKEKFENGGVLNCFKLENLALGQNRAAPLWEGGPTFTGYEQCKYIISMRHFLYFFYLSNRCSVISGHFWQNTSVFNQIRIAI